MILTGNTISDLLCVKESGKNIEIFFNMLEYFLEFVPFFFLGIGGFSTLNVGVQFL